MKVLTLGITGMLGNTVFRYLSKSDGIEAWGTLRSERGRRHFPSANQSQIISGVDVLNQDMLISVLSKAKPDVVINCIGLIKQLAVANDPLSVLPINAMLPHRLSRLCEIMNARLIHISTDCVFSGRTGMYVEESTSDADDLYGKSKYIGEIHDQDNVITLRTSIIGHELGSSNALVNWFLGQEGSVKGYAKAIFSGLPTIELARVMRDYVLPKPKLSGLYHVSAEPIDKLSLLKMVADIYDKNIQIIADDEVKIDRSLDSTRFRKASGYIPPKWPEMIRAMHEQR